MSKKTTSKGSLVKRSYKHYPTGKEVIVEAISLQDAIRQVSNMFPGSNITNFQSVAGGRRVILSSPTSQVGELKFVP